MKKLVTKIARFLLWALTSMFSFAIACAYGMFYNYSRGGRVVDAVTHAGITGISVSCRSGGAVDSSAVTAADGTFGLEGYACETVVAEDVDGAANGSYLTATTPFPASGDIIIIIEMNPTPTP
jgi:hypothetical protein